MEYNLIFMYTLTNKQGLFLTNYGMQKWWFTDNIEFSYTFENLQDALRFSHYYTTEETEVYTIYTKF
jgi:hypothetical protein